MRARELDKKVERLSDQRMEEDDSDIVSEDEESDMIGLLCKIAKKNRIDVIEGPGIARTVPMQAGSSTIIETLIQTKKDKLWTRDDNILNFASCDCVLTTPINRDLLSKGLIKLAMIFGLLSLTPKYTPTWPCRDDFH